MTARAWLRMRSQTVDAGMGSGVYSGSQQLFSQPDSPPRHPRLQARQLGIEDDGGHPATATGISTPEAGEDGAGENTGGQTADIPGQETSRSSHQGGDFSPRSGWRGDRRIPALELLRFV